MVGARIARDGGLHPRVSQPCRVALTPASDRIAFCGNDYGGRQCAQVRRMGRHPVLVVRRAAAGVGELVHVDDVVVAEHRSIAKCDHRLRRHIAVEARVEQHLTADGGTAAIPCRECHRRSQRATRTVADDRQSCDVDAQLLRVPRNPFGGRICVVELGRCGELWSEPVVHRHDGGVRLGGKRSRQRLERMVGPHHHAAAVEVDQHGRARRGRGAVDPDGNLTGGSGDRAILDIRHRRHVVWMWCGLDRVPHGCQAALSHRWDRTERGDSRGGVRVECSLALRVETTAVTAAPAASGRQGLLRVRPSPSRHSQVG